MELSNAVAVPEITNSRCIAGTQRCARALGGCVRIVYALTPPIVLALLAMGALTFFKDVGRIAEPAVVSIQASVDDIELQVESMKETGEKIKKLGVPLQLAKKTVTGAFEAIPEKIKGPGFTIPLPGMKGLRKAGSALATLFTFPAHMIDALAPVDLIEKDVQQIQTTATDAWQRIYSEMSKIGKPTLLLLAILLIWHLLRYVQWAVIEIQAGCSLILGVNTNTTT